VARRNFQSQTSLFKSERQTEHVTEDSMRIALLRLDAALLASFVWWGFGAFPALAQNLDLDGDFVIGLPQNEFRDKLNEQGYGLSGHFGYFLADMPIMVGAEIGFLNYGTENRHTPVSDMIPDVIVEVQTTNNILMIHGFARIQPQSGAFRPYFEGLWGFRYFFTQTTIRDDSHYYEPIASSTNFDDLAGSYGFGTGVDIRIWKRHPKAPGRGVFDVSLSFSAKYFWGSEAEYLKKGSIRRDPDGGITYLVQRSKTDMLMPRVGISVRF
jgi:hypothetical protein